MHQVLKQVKNFRHTQIEGVEDAGVGRDDGRQPQRVEHLAPHCEGSPQYQVNQINKIEKSKHLKGRSRELVRHNLFDP